MIPEANRFRRALGRWFRAHGRELPWRTHPDPYAVLVSEFMLQQTTVAAVRPYFLRWMHKFPTVGDLAKASEAEVLSLWEGLGYYSRARNLKKAAAFVVAEFGGVIPSDLESLRRLPGVGPYTAAAIAAFAFDQCVPVIDANIQRVIARLINYRENIATARARETIEAAAREVLPSRGGARHSAALMDLGATICRSGPPDCPKCPVRSFCQATEPASIPNKPARAELIHETDTRAFALARGKLYLVASDGPRWKGLWLLPPHQPSGISVASLKFAVTRHRISLDVFPARPQPGWTPFPLTSLPAMPSPHRKALAMALAGPLS